MITEDNLVVSIDSVIYFQVTDPKAATYEIANYIQAIEQLTVTTLRNVIGGMALEETLTSRDEINTQLRGVLDEATGKWGIRVNRVELKAIDPPASIQETMEKQMRADREKRAAILTAEGVKQSQILTAEGEKQSAILSAEGQRQAMILQAEGQAKAIETVFKAIHEGDPDPKLLAYQYLQMLPQIAQGDANKIWIIPSELTQALGNLERDGESARSRAGPVRPRASPRSRSSPGVGDVRPGCSTRGPRSSRLRCGERRRLAFGQQLEPRARVVAPRARAQRDRPARDSRDTMRDDDGWFVPLPTWTCQRSAARERRREVPADLRARRRSSGAASSTGTGGSQRRPLTGPGLAGIERDVLRDVVDLVEVQILQQLARERAAAAALRDQGHDLCRRSACGRRGPSQACSRPAGRTT